MKRLLTACAILLIYAGIIEMGYEFYIFLKIVISFSTGLYLFLNFESVESSLDYWNIGLILIFVLFNPLYPIPFERETWQTIDICCTVLILGKAYNMKHGNIIEKS